MKTWLWILFAGCLAGISPAQRLRDGVAAADRVVVGKQVSAQPWGEHLMLHQLEVLQTLKGEPVDRLVVVEITSISGHAHPAPGETRLYCLHDYTRSAQKAGLPEHGGPFFKMSGYQGSNPNLVENLDDDPHMALARIVLDAEVGVSTQHTAFALVDLALKGAPSVRREATAMLSERPILRSKLTAVHWGELLARTAGETADIPFKISLAQLCAEQRLDGLVDALCLSIAEVDEPTYAQFVGRITRALHGEGSLEVLRPHLLRSTKEHRGRLLLALGATSTESALNALLRMHSLGKDPYVDAALRQHNSPRARAALKRRR